jgi:hypothetical protein
MHFPGSLEQFEELGDDGLVFRPGDNSDHELRSLVIRPISFSRSSRHICA